MNQKDAIEIICEKIREENDGEHIDYLLPGYVATKLLGYEGMRRDLLLCKEAVIKFFSHPSDEIIASCLYYTFIALYGKCFTDASSSKRPKLDESDFDDTHKHLIDAHRELMDLRHNFVAHRGESTNELGIAYLKLNIKTFERQVKVRQLVRTKPQKEKLPIYVQLLDYLISITEQKFYSAGVKVWQHMLKEYTPEMLAQLILAKPSS